MGMWTRRYLIIKNPDDGLCWQLRYSDKAEIVGEIDDFYFLWVKGTSIAFPQNGKYKYIIETETVNSE